MTTTYRTIFVIALEIASYIILRKTLKAEGHGSLDYFIPYLMNFPALLFWQVSSPKDSSKIKMKRFFIATGGFIFLFLLYGGFLMLFLKAGVKL